MVVSNGSHYGIVSVVSLGVCYIDVYFNWKHATSIPSRANGCAIARAAEGLVPHFKALRS